MPQNEPVLSYAPGTREREVLQGTLRAPLQMVEIGSRFSGSEHRTGAAHSLAMPHARHEKIVTFWHATAAETQGAIDAALVAARDWSRTHFEDRARIFLKAADLLAGPYRARINAACMLGQSKTVFQSEIDAVCEMADFLRFNVQFYRDLLQHQPISPPGVRNEMQLRPLEGFVYAVAPFNFLSIAMNLPLAPILCGNVAVWKPASSTLLGCHAMLDLLHEAGLPDDVLTLVVGDGPLQSDVVLKSAHLAGLHFTGSTATFSRLYQGIAQELSRYRTFPRVVGETGGKNFVLAHPSADVDALAAAIVRGGYEYQGQKCSAASRVYVPKSLWPKLRKRLVDTVTSLRMGDVRDFANFVNAVIDERAFARIAGYQALARDSANVLAGGNADDRNGFFVEPTLVEVSDPKHKLMQEEIFGPLVTCWVYPDAEFESVLTTIDETSGYALTGAVFATEVSAIRLARTKLSQAAGNFYINDKPTGAVVGQQPFGGARASGTNDKAGSFYNLVRWVSPRVIKETFVPPTDYRYPFMD